ncbi:MAG: hypothetical protein ACI4HI_12275 [Lachnospiraceae bacterium]
MKLKQWLREQKNMTYQTYRELPEEEQDSLRYEHQRFCRRQQIHDRQNWRPMTEEEKEKVKMWADKEKKRYEINLKIGGIDERGNYTALHHRWEN